MYGSPGNIWLVSNGLLAVHLFYEGAIFCHDCLQAAVECVSGLVGVFRHFLVPFSHYVVMDSHTVARLA
jgi:hypothetical protein